jgi:hypothetical protein
MNSSNSLYLIFLGAFIHKMYTITDYTTQE